MTVDAWQTPAAVQFGGAPNHPERPGPLRQTTEPIQVVIAGDRDAPAIQATLQGSAIQANYVSLRHTADMRTVVLVSASILILSVGSQGLTVGEAIQALEECAGLAPVILVGEDVTAVDVLGMLRHGATEFLPRDQLFRLDFAIQRALEANQLKRSERRERELKDGMERRLHALLETGSEAIVLVDEDGNCQFASPNCERLLGYGSAKIQNRRALAAVHPEDRPAVAGALQQLGAQPGRTQSIQARLRHGNGGWRWFECRGRNLLGEPSVGAIAVSLREISDRKLVEERLRFQARLIDAVGQAIIVTDPQGEIVHWNRFSENLFGWSTAEILGRNLRCLLAASPDMEPALVFEQLRKGGSLNAEVLARRRDASVFPAVVSSWPIFDEVGAFVGVVCAARDDTARSQAEKARRQSEAQVRFQANLLDMVDQAVVANDLKGRTIYWNRYAEKLFGWTAEEALGKRLITTAPQARAEAPGIFEQLLAGKSFTGELAMQSRDGAIFPALHVSSPIFDQQGRVVGTVGIISDMTERHRAEQALAQLAAIARSSRDAMIGVDLDGMIVTWNAGAEAIFGYPDQGAIGLAFSTLFPPHVAPDLEERLEHLQSGSGSHELEIPGRRCGGGEVDLLLTLSPMVDASGAVIGVAGVARDLTQRKQAEIELRQGQKLESVGRLAAGIAHEINTPVQFIGDNVRFLAESFTGLFQALEVYEQLESDSHVVLPSPTLEAIGKAKLAADLEFVGEEVPRAIEQTLEGVERVTTIVRAMKEFAYPDQKEKVPVDLNQGLRNTLIVARNELKYVADVTTDLADLPEVYCHPGNLNQVFLNLLINAAHAIEDRHTGQGARGTIAVRSFTEGDMVVVSIRDTGCGIPAAVASRIFDPFFTTKAVGRGTGQGLALARSIVVDQHGGSLTFQTTTGEGTTFFIRLPLGGIDSQHEWEAT